MSALLMALAGSSRLAQQIAQGSMQVMVFYAEASKGSEKFTLGNGRLEVLTSLAYTGDPGAFDGRTAAEKERDDIEAALAKFKDGAQEYSIGNRTFKRVAMADCRCV